MIPSLGCLCVLGCGHNLSGMTNATGNSVGVHSFSLKVCSLTVQASNTTHYCFHIYARTNWYLILPDQITWWDNNGKQFDFFKLPLEMRQLLYLEFLGGGIILPQVRSKGARSRSVTFGHGDKTVPKDRVGSKIDPDIVHPDPKILLVCQRTYHEAKDAVWTCATKRFSSTSSFNRLNISQIRLHGHPKALNRVQLELPAAHYFELIGIRPRFGAPFAPMFAGDQAVALGLLKSFNTVKYLDFRFISPKHERAICPWGSIPRRAASSQEHSCQKVWIDWFFTLAFEHLLGWICKSHNEENKITRVKTIITMSGCIKKSTRDKWETIFPAEQKLKTHGGPPSFLDQLKDAAVEIRKTKQDDLPIKCDCSYPCSATNIPENGYVRFADSDLRRHVAGPEEAIQETYFSFKDYCWTYKFTYLSISILGCFSRADLRWLGFQFVGSDVVSQICGGFSIGK